MKKTLLFSCATLLAASMQAQLPDGTIAPDFTGTDLNGNTHNLYDYLDQGYTVIVDVSATWCGPCWAYHNSHALRDVFEDHGPGTADDRVIVLFIEGDEDTTVPELNGIGSATQGNWVQGTPYPIINDHNIADLLQITYFPTIYRICPSRVITEVGQQTASSLWNGIQANCPVASMAFDPSLIADPSTPSVCAGETVSLEVNLMNLGLTPLTAATIEASVGSTVIGSVEWTGNLDTYGITTVEVAQYQPTPGNNNITYQITDQDDDGSNNSINSTIVAGAMETTEITLELRTDNYGEETTWKLFDSNNSVVQQDPAGQYGDNQTYNYTWTLNEQECYRFEIYDAYGDGICCDYGNGFYKLKENGQVIMQGGQFADEDERSFKTGMPVSIEENSLNAGLSVFPNPSTGNITVSLNNEAGNNAIVNVYDAIGSLVHTGNIAGKGAQQIVLDLSDLSNGIYQLELQAGDLRAVRKITLAR